MNKKYRVEYWEKDNPEDREAFNELPTREEAEEKQAELAEEGYGSEIIEIRV